MLLRTPKTLGVDTFPDPVSHFGPPWRTFWILQAVRRYRRCGAFLSNFDILNDKFCLHFLEHPNNINENVQFFLQDEKWQQIQNCNFQITCKFLLQLGKSIHIETTSYMKTNTNKMTWNMNTILNMMISDWGEKIKPKSNKLNRLKFFLFILVNFYLP